MPILSDEELTALVNACKGKTFNDLRDAAVIRLLIDCGMRVRELTGIEIKDLDLDGESVAVTGKGRGCGRPTSGPNRPGARPLPAGAPGTPARGEPSTVPRRARPVSPRTVFGNASRCEPAWQAWSQPDAPAPIPAHQRP